LTLLASVPASVSIVPVVAVPVHNKVVHAYPLYRTKTTVFPVSNPVAVHVIVLFSPVGPLLTNVVFIGQVFVHVQVAE